MSVAGFVRSRWQLSTGLAGSFHRISWQVCAGIRTVLGFDEKVLGNGPFIAYNNINIVLLPDTNQIDYNLTPEFSWLKAKLRFGYMQVDSPWDWAENITPWGYPEDVGNNSVPSPADNAGWNQVGSVGAAYEIY